MAKLKPWVRMGITEEQWNEKQRKTRAFADSVEGIQRTPPKRKRNDRLALDTPASRQ